MLKVEVGSTQSNPTHSARAICNARDAARLPKRAASTLLALAHPVFKRYFLFAGMLISSQLSVNSSQFLITLCQVNPLAWFRVFTNQNF